MKACRWGADGCRPVVPAVSAVRSFVSQEVFAGDYRTLSDPVPPGRVWLVYTFVLFPDGAGTVLLKIKNDDTGGDVILAQGLDTVANVPIPFPRLVLDEGWYPWIHPSGVDVGVMMSGLELVKS